MKKKLRLLNLQVDLFNGDLMSAYKKLLNNSLVFAIGNVGSKAIAFILVPIYTFYLTSAEYGTIDLAVTTANLMIPLISLCVYEAVLRFIMDVNSNIKEIYTNGIILTFLSSIAALAIFLVAYLLFTEKNFSNSLVIIVYLLVVSQMFQKLHSQFAKALDKNKLYAFNGILLTLLIGILNIIFVVLLDYGVMGYLCSLIISYWLSTLFIVIMTKSYLYFDNNLHNWILQKKLLLYSIPLIPNSIMWWATDSLSRYLIGFYLGVSANGYYAVASRLPSLITVFSDVFYQAWQLSAIDEYEKDNKDFYTDIFTIYYTFLFLVASFIMIILKPIFRNFIAQEYYPSWSIVPFLLLSVIFASLSSFMGAFYVASKNTGGVLKTSILGGFFATILSFVLIPTIGLEGAGIASMVSYILMFISRFLEVKRKIKIAMNMKIFTVNISIIAVQIFVLFLNLNVTSEIFIQILLIVCNLIANKNILIKISILISNFIIAKNKQKGE